MTNGDYITILEQHEVKREAIWTQREVQRNRWIEDKAPYKSGQIIIAPFELYMTVPYTYERKVRIITVSPEKINGLFWTWRVTAGEGKEIFTWFEKMEI